ncbi:MAG: cystathionine beta-lyase [Methylocystaceae bacterium]|nr:cystathionine beta-lyase [Methylocystaceae bacterium]
MKKDTQLLHAGRHPKDNYGIVNPPVYHASTVTFPTVDALYQADKNPTEGIFYGRMGTPTSRAFEEAVATLEGGDKAIAVQSGLAGITGAMLAFVKGGDHILVADSVYFPTKKFCNEFLSNFGVEVTYYDPMIADGIKSLIKDNTRLIFTEAPGSLTFEVQDIPAIAKAAHERDVLVMIDNTWSAGYYFNAFEHGCDVSIQAATKYIGGHSDIMMGTITLREEHYKMVKTKLNVLGYCAGPDDCYLAQRGLRSLPARLARHEENGLKMAAWLKERPEVTKVLHPAFADCPGHDIWKRDFTGSSGLFSIVLDGKYSPKAVAAMLDGLELFPMGYSWGGYESLIVPFNPKGARNVTTWVEDGACLRIHAGQESIDDLLVDLNSGFERLNKP